MSISTEPHEFKDSSNDSYVSCKFCKIIIRKDIMYNDGNRNYFFTNLPTKKLSVVNVTIHNC